MKRLKVYVSFLGMLIVSIISINAQKIEGLITDNEDNPLWGVNVHFAETQVATVTDSSGRFTIEKPDSADLLVVSFIGYHSDTLSVSGKTVIIKMFPTSFNLNEATIIAEWDATSFVQNEVHLVEYLSEVEFTKAACCNIGEGFSTNAAVDVSYSDAVTGAKSIQMLGLDGRYVQLTTELLPSIRGLASPFGLSYIPGTWLESIQISKGAGSVANGYEAVTGQINAELKKPFNTDRLFLNVYVNHMGKLEGNVHFSFRMGKWSTLTLMHGDYFNTMADANSDGFLDMPLIKGGNFVHRWQFRGKRFMTQFGVKGLFELRNGGTTAFYRNDSLAPQFGVQMTTWRGEGFAKCGILFPGMEWKSIGIQANFIYHDQRGFIGLNGYKGIQKNGYLNIIYQSILGNTKHKFKTGASFVYDDYDETYSLINLKRTELVPGGFFEYTMDDIRNVTFVAGVRLDYHNLFGFQPTPRINLRWEITEGLIFRAAGGRGWRVPNVFADNIPVLVTSRSIEIQDAIKPEIAWNYGASLQYAFKINKNDATLVVDFFRTDFTNQLMVDREDEDKLVFYNMVGPSFSNVFQFSFNVEPVRKFEVRTAYKFQDVKATLGGELKTVPLVPKHRVLLNLAYTTPKLGFTFDFTTQVIGNSRLPDLTDPNFTVYNGVTPWYVILNAQITKDFKVLEWYIGCENITGYTQDNPLIDASNPFGNKFDASMVFAPIFGRMFYTGLRFKLDYKPSKKKR